jgi:hypothetical protein
MASLNLPGRFESLVSAREIRFPGTRDFGSKRRGSNTRLFGGKAEYLVLAGPFSRQDCEAGDAMPRGSRPSIAALARSGARNASEIVMLTLRALHPSRSAMLSAVAFASSVAVLHLYIRPLIEAFCFRPSWISARLRPHWRKGLVGPKVPPVFAGAGKTGPPSRFVLSQTSVDTGVGCAGLTITQPEACSLRSLGRGPTHSTRSERAC